MTGVGQLPSTDNLLCFRAAAHHLNFRKAAEEMALTPTAFGQRIKQLEEQLATELFYRTTRHVELTEAGRALLPEAERALLELQRCAVAVHEDLENIPVHMTLGTRFELGVSWLVPALAELRERRPNWQIDLYFGSGPDILDRLENGRLDAIVTSAPVARTGWESEFLHPEAYVFCGAASLVAKTPFTCAEDASNHVLLDIDRDLPLTRYLTSTGPTLAFRDVWLCGAGAAMLRFVRDGHGVGVLPEYMARDDLAAGTLVQLLPEFELLTDSFRVLYRAQSPLRRAMRSLGEFLRERPLE